MMTRVCDQRGRRERRADFLNCKFFLILYLFFSDFHKWACLAWPSFSVLVLQGCHSKLPQTGWVKTTEMYSLIVLEVRSTNSRCWQTQFLLDALRENLAHGSLLVYGTCQQSLVFFGLWLHHSISTPVFTWCFPLCLLCLCPNFPFLLRIAVNELGPTLIHYDLILTNYTCKELFFFFPQISHILRFQVNVNFGDHYSTQYSPPSLLPFLTSSSLISSSNHISLLEAQR